MTGTLTDHVLLFHEYFTPIGASAPCPGIITSEPKAGIPVLRLYCVECGKDVGLIEIGLLEEFLALIPGASK
jgi:hypothetical protein